MPFRRRMANGILVVSTASAHAAELERLQELVFPTLAPEQRFRAPHYLRHIEMFPEGQFVALDAGRVVGATSTLRLEFDPAHPDHRFDDIIQGGWLGAHRPDGPWLYGADIGTHPDHRGRGIARALYAARHETVRRLGLLGQVTVGMLSGYGAVSGRMPIEEYYRRLEAGDLTDPTVSAQRKVGFDLRGLVRDYLDDPVCGNSGACLVLPAERDVPADWAPDEERATSEGQ